VQEQVIVNSIFQVLLTTIPKVQARTSVLPHLPLYVCYLPADFFHVNQKEKTSFAFPRVSWVLVFSPGGQHV